MTLVTRWLWGAVALSVLSLQASSTRQEFSDFTIPMPLQPGDALVIGIMGGWERWDAEDRGIRRTALELRDEKLPRVHIETVENHSLRLAFHLIHAAFDFNQDGALEPGEKARIKLILFGHSLGGSALVRMTRELAGMGIPVDLAIVVDSVGRHDRVIPPNVRAAVNLFQRDGYFGFLGVRGESEIRAADPSRTEILGNFRYRYRNSPVKSRDTWVRRFFFFGHSKMEYDLAVWGRVKCFIGQAAGGRDWSACR